MGAGAAVVNAARNAANAMGLDGTDSWRWTQEQARDFQNRTGYDADLLSLTGPRDNGLLAKIMETVIRVGAPIAIAANPWLLATLGPTLGGAVGAGLGGAFGSTVMGDPLKQVLLSGAASGAGNFLGGQFSDALKGLGGAGGGAGGSGLDAIRAGVGGITDTLGNVASTGAQLANAGVNLASGVTGGIGSAVGGALGGVTGAAGGAGAGGAAGGGVGAGSTATEVSPFTVTGATPTGALGDLLGGGLAPLTPSLTEAPDPTYNTDFMDDSYRPGGQKPLGIDPVDVIGQGVGGVAGDALTYGLAGLLGLGPNTQTLTAEGFDTAPDPGTGVSKPTVTGDPKPAGGGGGFVPPATPAVPGLPTANAGGGGGGAPTGALSQVLASAGGAPGGAPIAAAPSLDLRGSTAPDIYPWRGRRLVAA